MESFGRTARALANGVPRQAQQAQDRGRAEGGDATVLDVLPARTSKTALPNSAVRLGALDGLVGFHLRLAQEASFAAFARRVGQSDLRPGHFAFLALIGENPGLTQTALGAAAGRDKSTLTPALDDLERRGLILRRRAAASRRSYELFLTAAGETALRGLIAHAEAHDSEIDRMIGPEERAALIRALRRIARGLA
jgi:DNA-binding MarR family transcriptional regulator